MIDISTRMSVFKEAVRHNWNSYFLSSADPMSAATQEKFCDIERALLQVIVFGINDVCSVADDYRTRVLNEILVKPIFLAGEVPVRYGRRESNGNFVWEQEELISVAQETRFHFYDFFDWNFYGLIDLPFVRVRISAQSENGSERIALIEHRFCKFFLNMGEVGAF